MIVAQNGNVTTSGTGSQSLSVYTVPAGRTLYVLGGAVWTAATAAAATIIGLASVSGSIDMPIVAAAIASFCASIPQPGFAIAGGGQVYVRAAGWPANTVLDYNFWGVLV